MRVIIVLIPAVMAGVLATVLISRAAEADRPVPPVVVDEPTVVDPPVIVDVPAFPGVAPREPVRLWVGSFVAPGAEFGDTDVTLLRPEIHARANLPLDTLASVQVTGTFSASHYDVDGRHALFADCAACPEPGDLYSASLGTQGGYQLNRKGHLFFLHEQWALLGALFVAARWESGAFSDSVTPGFSLGLGYQLPQHLRLALEARVARALDGDGVTVGPSVYVRFDLLPELRLKSRGLGGQLEYQPSKRFDLYVTGYRNSDDFRLNERSGLSSGATFQDRQVLVGAGMVFRMIRELRFAAEVGAIVDRRLELSTAGGDRDESRNGDPSLYFDLRVEGRI